MASVLAEIRTRCAQVAEDARFVRLDAARIGPYARELAALRAAPPELDPERHYLGHGSATAAFILTLDSINFGSGYFPHLRKLPGMSGYFTVATRLTEYFRTKGPLPAEELATMTSERCTAIFRQDPANPVVTELMDLFARALRDLGTLLLERYGGQAERLIATADGRAERLVELLAAMPFFRDVERYRDVAVPFYKRAQLAAADLALAFGSEGLGRFEDLDRLTIFADNLVPHVLRVDGVLHYDPDLRAAIDAGELIPAGSPQEIEIRAVALHAVERLAEACGLPAMRLDYLLWNRGQTPAYKAIPRHRTRTVFY